MNLTINEHRKFIKERDKALMTRDVKQFKKFVMKCKYYNIIEKIRFLLLPKINIEIAMHKIIANSNFPLEIRQESENWLANRGLSTSVDKD